MIDMSARWGRAGAGAERRAMRAAALPALLAAGLTLWCATTAFAQIKASYVHSLSSLAGRIPYDGVRIRLDDERGETYVIYQNVVRVFNPSGMEVFSFGDGLELGQILDVAVDRKGDIILLSFKDSRSLLTRCSFRGVPLGPVEVRGLPDGLGFAANRMVLRNGLFYFLSLSGSTVTVTGENAEYHRHIELLPLLEADDREKGEAEVIGFTVDQEGSIFVTLPALFKVYKVSPDGRVRSFGRAGSAPGRFGIVAGVVSDGHGNLFVTDRLKCVVMVFDKDFNFVTEFGYRGTRPENLIQPDDLAIDRNDRLYVSQWRKRGVSVFGLVRN